MLISYSNSRPCPICGTRKTARSSRRQPSDPQKPDVWSCQECRIAFEVPVNALRLKEVSYVE